MISQFLERVLTEHIKLIYSLDSKLFFISLCSIRINSGNWDNAEKSNFFTLSAPPWSWFQVLPLPLCTCRTIQIKSSPRRRSPLPRANKPFNIFAPKFFSYFRHSVLYITRFQERIRMEHIYKKASPDSKLQISSICSVRIHSRKWDTFEKPLERYFLIF